MTTYRCAVCKGTNVQRQMRVWVYVNTWVPDPDDEMGELTPTDEWCCDCGELVELTEEEDGIVGSMNTKATMVCNKCGSEALTQLFWHDLRTGEELDVADDVETGTQCTDCDDWCVAVLQAEFAAEQEAEELRHWIDEARRLLDVLTVAEAARVIGRRIKKAKTTTQQNRNHQVQAAFCVLLHGTMTRGRLCPGETCPGCGLKGER